VDYEMVKREIHTAGGKPGWSGRIFLYQEGFWFSRSHQQQDPSPRTAGYKPNSIRSHTSTNDYALSCAANEKANQRILLSMGSIPQGSLADRYVTHEERLSELERPAEPYTGQANHPAYFQVLLKPASRIRPGQTELVVFALYPP